MSEELAPLSPEDLIDDRELESPDGDRFAHSDFVVELAQLALTVKAPANVALFAPWGSGKSSLGNLLRAELEPEIKKGNLKFAKFDAFKFGEAPLRRHFISQVAKALGRGNDKEFSDDLYRSKEEQIVKMPTLDYGKVLLGFALALAIAAVGVFSVAALIGVLVSLIRKQDLFGEWWPVAKVAFIALFPVSAVGTSVIQIAGSGLTFNSKRAAPSGEEEFERLFKKLIGRVRDGRPERRVVIFIDELDRCTPAEVVSTLETMKTFLGVDGCVFIVAADMQVLEQALRNSPRQQTPRDVANPYYSSGSSYLDKVFQYQLSLPPLTSRRLTDYALTLVEGRGGIWSQIQSVEEVVSVLIPVHVTSPRRVKVLLNSFALTFRLALRRAQGGRLEANIQDRASEIAKLVCLRCEFPLFADDLSFDQRLPELVLLCADGEELPNNVSKEAAARAQSYAHGELPVGELLTSDAPFSELTSAIREGLERMRGATPAATPAAANGQAPTTPGTDGPGASESNGTDEVQREYALQLIRYLRKTDQISNPGSDLIYLESPGASFGLDPVLANTLQRDALNGDTKKVIDAVAGESAETQRACVLLLADLVNQKPVGLEGQNVVATLLETVASVDADLASVADRVADAISGHLTKTKLRDSDLAGAMRVALMSTRTGVNALRDQVLDHEGALDDLEVATVVVENVLRFPPAKAAELVQAATNVFFHDNSLFVEVIGRLDRQQALRLIEALREPLAENPEGLADDDEAIPIEGGLDALLRRVAPDDDMVVINAAFRVSLDIDSKGARNAVQHHLGRLGRVTDGALTVKLLGSMGHRVPELWPTWLGVLSAEVIATSSECKAALGSVGSTLWANFRKADDDDKVSAAQTALDAIAKLIHDGASPDVQPVIDAIKQDLTGPFQAQGAVDSQRKALADAAKFVKAGVIPGDVVAKLDLACCLETLQTAIQPQLAATADSVAGAALSERISASVSSGDSEQLDGISAALTVSNWISHPRQETLILQVAAARHALDAAVESPYSADQVAEHLTQYGDEFAKGAASWIGGFAPSPDDLWTAIRPIAAGNLPSPIFEALQKRAHGLNASELYALAGPALADVFSTQPGGNFLDAIRFADANVNDVCDRLIELATAAETDDQWRTVMTLWQQRRPSSTTVRDRLVDGIYLPLIKRGPSGVDMALNYFGLVAAIDGKSPRERVRNALRTHVEGDEQGKRVEDKLIDAKWAKKEGILRKSVVDVNDE